ncbi:MAG: hypothetical protein K2K52_07155, partial [Paramuribaculum sp.]|nr:hypothetical protein [Paramuribaculum sp.]
MEVVSKSENRINLESKTHKAAVRLTWNNKRKKWLLTAFEKKETSEPIAKTTDTDNNPSDSRGDTALSQNSDVSEGKGSESEAEKQEVGAGSVSDAIKRAESEVNTEPTEAQKAAGNYRKGHVKIDGYEVTIEQPKGSIRSGVDASGKEWKQEMHNTYGYIRGTKGVDGDHIDVFLSDAPESGDVYVVDQYNPDGSFDEHKVMYGFADAESARKAYLSNYEEGWEDGRRLDITGVSKEEFRKWVDSSTRKGKPFADYKSVKPLDIDKVSEDNQGNPVDESGKLIVEDVMSVDEITDEDFTSPKRTIGLPAIPENIDKAIGADGRKVIIKRSVFNKNLNAHGELTPADSRDIISKALYNPDLIGTNQPLRRPDYKVAIQTGDKNAVVVLDVYSGKDNVEIVGWRKIDAKGLERMKRQAEREGGQFLILSPESGSAAALSALPSDVSSVGKGSEVGAKKQNNPAIIEDFGEEIAGARKNMLKEMSKRFEVATVQALIEQPFSKVVKRPDFGRAVAQGAMTAEEAMAAEALWQSVYSAKKPTATRSNASKVSKWAASTYDKIKRLEEFVNAEPERRRELMSALSEVSYPGQAAEAEHFNKIKGWNSDKQFAEPVFTPDAAWVNMEVMKRIGSQPGDKLTIPFSIATDSAHQQYELRDSSGNRLWRFKASRNIDDVLDAMALAVKISRGDTDIDYPVDCFRVKGEGARYAETGE